jgi:hypothetical protein
MASGRPQCVQDQPALASLPTSASLPAQTLGLRLAQPQLLTIKGQLSKSFVMQHVHPSLP